MNGKDVIKKLQKEGWMLLRVNGSHHIMTKAGFPRPVPVPVHGSTDLKKPLIRAIERQTGAKLL
jgi:predicted RNA binding protein YcfA (HicA-like mRNA interferase family)